MVPPTRLVNLTGHDLTLIQWNGATTTIRPEGQLRVYSKVDAAGIVRVGGVDVPLLEIVEQAITPPPEQPDTLYVVSGIVASKARRNDLVVPSRMVRDGTGKVIGCRALAKVRLT